MVYWISKSSSRRIIWRHETKVALIRTLALNPEVLLLDEPFSALDYQTRLNISDEIYNIIKKKVKQL